MQGDTKNLRERLGQLVREVWVSWAEQQPDCRESWRVPYSHLSERDKDVDRRIGEAIWMFTAQALFFETVVFDVFAEDTETNMVLRDVRRERERQNLLWGIQEHDLFAWMTIIGKQLGEVYKATLLLKAPEGSNTLAEMKRGELTQLREELIQTAAVAAAIVEYIDRQTNQATLGYGTLVGRAPKPDIRFEDAE